MYAITHLFLATDDDDARPVVRVETDPDVATADQIADLIAAMIESPGGGSGTTIALTVSLTRPTSL